MNNEKTTPPLCFSFLHFGINLNLHRWWPGEVCHPIFPCIFIPTSICCILYLIFSEGGVLCMDFFFSKLCRWWPGEVCHPESVPVNIQEKTHQVGEFPIKFFGTHEYVWLHRGRWVEIEFIIWSGCITYRNYKI